MAFMAAPYLRRANYYETDKMGIIHHSNYIRWFEEARFFCMRQLSLSYKAMEDFGILMPVIDVKCKYRVPVRFDEEVSVCTSLVFFDGLRASFTYEVYKAEDNELAVTGESSHCFIDEQTRRPLSLKKRCPDFYDNAVRLLEADLNTNFIEGVHL